VHDPQVSRRLSFVLRHDPGSIGIDLDEAGWVQVPVLLDALAQHGLVLARTRLESIVRASPKQRFALDAAGDRIRANQGHSVAVELGLEAAVPPVELYHGTPERNVSAILGEGLVRGSRHAVHLSPDVSTARQVGSRRGRAAVLVVRAASMHADGFRFEQSTNGVWLTERVPASYLSMLRSG
jgi:putative RNA 2'-phosphotransferase